MTPDTLTAELLATGPFVRAAAPYRLLEVEGRDAGEFLHRLSTQDVQGLGDGQVRPAAFLDAKGKLLVTCLIGRLGSTFYLEVQQEQHDRLAALLERYHFTEQLAIRASPLAPCCEWVRAAAGDADSGQLVRTPAGLVFAYARRGVGFVRAHGEGAAVVGAVVPQGEALSGCEPLSGERAEALRMLAGMVRVGVETEPTTLLLEADLDDHCSTTKGCYTGQEIVARIHTYGHVNRKLCLLQLTPGVAIEAAEPLHDEDDLPVGRVLHAVPVPDRELRLGLGFLPKDFQAVGTVLKLAAGGTATVLR